MFKMACFAMSLAICTVTVANGNTLVRPQSLSEILEYGHDLEATGKSRTEQVILLNKAIKKLTKEEKAILQNEVVSIVKTAYAQDGDNINASVDPIILIILAILIPPVAVGLHTDWAAKPTLINLILTLIFYIPGMIHALYVVTR